MTRLAVTAPDRTAPEATPKRKAAGSDTSGVPELIGKIPVGKGTVMGFVTVTIQKVGQGLRINAGSFADMTIDKIGGQWVVEQPGKPTEVIERATTASDGNGGVDATIDLKGARSPITFGIGADGRSLVCDGYSVQIS